MKSTYCSGFVEMPNATKVDKILLAAGEEPEGMIYQANCRCGWQGLEWNDVNDARDEIAAHLLENPIELK